MAKRQRSSSNDCRIEIRGVRRKRSDVRKFAKAVIDLALEQAAREAEAARSVETSTEETSASAKTRKEAA